MPPPPGISRILNVRVPPMSGKDIQPTLPASVSRRWGSINLVSAVGKRVLHEQDASRKVSTALPQVSPRQSSMVKKTLLELPFLRLGTANEVGGDIVRSAARAPGKLPEAPNARTAVERPNLTLQRDSPNILENTF